MRVVVHKFNSKASQQIRKDGTTCSSAENDDTCTTTTTTTRTTKSPLAVCNNSNQQIFLVQCSECKRELDSRLCFSKSQRTKRVDRRR
mmetsp:Transcript_10081/g.14996  ORF Transcript_10081/g.14996 Transcript_10081/m.14996 type:complete len:88 (+) Transcript_10081:31-294(+)